MSAEYHPYQKKASPISPPVGGVLSIVPGLGQMVSGYFTRGLILFVMIVSLFSLSYWRMIDAGLRFFVTPTEAQIESVEDNRDLNGVYFTSGGIETEEPLKVRQTQAVTHAVLVLFLSGIVYFWNIYDGYRSARRSPAPLRLAIIFLSVATLIIGAHITRIDLRKAIVEIGDVQPRLIQILYPWDDMWEREEISVDGVVRWEAPCDDTPLAPRVPEDGEPYLLVDPPCGIGSGDRRPDGTRDEGTRVTIQGFEFEPGEVAELIIKPASIPEFRVIGEDSQRIRVTPDEKGEFELEFIMPNLKLPSTAVGTIPVDIIVRQVHEVGSLRPNESFWLALEGIIETLFLALMATAVGLVLAVPLSFLAARNLMATNTAVITIYYVVRLILNTVRSIEPIIWALIAIIWVGPGPFAGVIALTLHTIASLGKLYSEAIESIDAGPIEAIHATGANRLQTIIYAVVPQVIPPFVSFTIYRWDINVRMSTIIGAVGGGGIGVVLIRWIQVGEYDSVGIAVWMIAIVVIILDYISARVREEYI